MMYDVMGIGTRIATKRRALGMTQENLAAKLGISAQAVSKWETGLGYPDITLLPQIAAALEISINTLFGQLKTNTEVEMATEPTDAPPIVFPATYDDLPLITSYLRCALYAAAKPEQIDADIVRFEDGSEADLTTHTVINRGRERILIVCEDELNVPPEPKSETKQEPVSDQYKRYHFDLGGRANVRLVPVDQGAKGGWQADGPPAFMQGLKIDTKGDTFSVKLAVREPVLGFHFFGNKWREKLGKITVFVPAARIDALDVRVRGIVEFASEIATAQSRIELSGSGTIQLQDAGDASMLVNGAGTLHCERANDGDFTINGAGTVEVTEVSGDVKCKLAGAGTIKLAGNIDTLTCKISGAGELKAKEAIVDKLEIDLNGASQAVIGRVRGQSIERISGFSQLSIKERG